jgi:ribonuclease P protein component
MVSLRTSNQFSRDRRLIGRDNFLRIQRSREGFKTENFIVRYESSQEPTARYGLTVSKRVGNAVARNRVKRCLREAIRLNSSKEKGVNVVFIAKGSAQEASFFVVEAEVRFALSKLGLIS